MPACLRGDRPEGDAVVAADHTHDGTAGVTVDRRAQMVVEPSRRRVHARQGIEGHLASLVEGVDDPKRLRRCASAAFDERRIRLEHDDARAVRLAELDVEQVHLNARGQHRRRAVRGPPSIGRRRLPRRGDQHDARILHAMPEAEHAADDGFPWSIHLVANRSHHAHTRTPPRRIDGSTFCADTSLPGMAVLGCRGS